VKSSLLHIDLVFGKGEVPGPNPGISSKSSGLKRYQGKKSGNYHGFRTFLLQKTIENKKMPNAFFDILFGIGLANQHFSNLCQLLCLEK